MALSLPGVFVAAQRPVVAGVAFAISIYFIAKARRLRKGAGAHWLFTRGIFTPKEFQGRGVDPCVGYYEG